MGGNRRWTTLVISGMLKLLKIVGWLFLWLAFIAFGLFVSHLVLKYNGEVLVACTLIALMVGYIIGVFTGINSNREYDKLGGDDNE
jgi:hypothetical protein